MKSLAWLVFLSACGTDDPDVVVEPGRLEHYGDFALVEASATAAVGREITVTLRTYGGGCTSHERTDVERHAGDVVIRPFDRTERPDGGICTDQLRRLEHAATVTFDTAGVKTIRVQGRRVAFEVDEMIEVPLSITVE